MNKEFPCSYGENPTVTVNLGATSLAPGNNGYGLVDGICEDCRYPWGHEAPWQIPKEKRHVQIRAGKIVDCRDTESPEDPENL